MRCVTAAPGEQWPDRLAELAGTALAAGRGALLCVPDRKDVDRVDRALTAALGPGHHVTLTADAGPARRYRDFLAVARGTRRVVVGTRAAAFAPVHRLGLVVCWDDGDDLHAEPRAPYPHTREVLLLRAEREGAAAVLGSFARSVEAQHLVHTGWAHEAVAPRSTVRERVTVAVAGATEHDLDRDPHALTARVPKQAHDAIRDGLATGPVLVQTPRAGYALALACERCRTPARCEACHGPLALTSPTTPPACRWCATPATGRSCPVCRAVGLRAPVLGDARTAEELGRAFPATRVRASAGDHVLADVGDEPALVVATPGAEPVAAGGYAAVVLLDTWLLLGRDDLRAAEEALRRWANAVGLVRPGGRALAVGDPAHPAIQALVRWDAGGFAARESADRATAHLPPASPRRHRVGRGRAGRRRPHPARPPRRARGARPGAARRRRGAAGPAGAPGPRRRPLPRPGRAAAGAVGAQARRRPGAGRPDRLLSRAPREAEVGTCGRADPSKWHDPTRWRRPAGPRAPPHRLWCVLRRRHGLRPEHDRRARRRPGRWPRAPTTSSCASRPGAASCPPTTRSPPGPPSWSPATAWCCSRRRRPPTPPRRGCCRSCSTPSTATPSRTWWTAAEEAGLLAEPPDYSQDAPQVTDMPSTTVEITADGETWTHSAYALGFEDEQGRRAALADFVDEAIDLLDEGDAEPYEPAAIRLAATDLTGASSPASTVAWPDAVDLRDVGECLVVDDPAAVAAVAQVLGEAAQDALFQQGDRTWSVSGAVVLPGEARPCADW